MLESNWSVRVTTDFSRFGLGWCGQFAFFGIGAIVIGPFVIHVTWPIA